MIFGMKILVVDDEPLIRNVIREYGENEGYQIEEAANGMLALELLQKETYDMLILDIMMPEMDGLSTCREIRKTSNIPILILSARSEEFDKLLGFDFGVDDYVTKPFSPKELIARIKAIAKRSFDSKNNMEVFQFHDLKIDYRGHQVFIKDEPLHLTPKEYELLVYFIQNKNIALSREQLLEKLWGYDFFGDDRTVDTHIKMLRNNLGEYRDLIVTVRGMGYKFAIQEK